MRARCAARTCTRQIREYCPILWCIGSVRSDDPGSGMLVADCRLMVRWSGREAPRRYEQTKSVLAGAVLASSAAVAVFLGVYALASAVLPFLLTWIDQFAAIPLLPELAGEIRTAGAVGLGAAAGGVTLRLVWRALRGPTRPGIALPTAGEVALFAADQLARRIKWARDKEAADRGLTHSALPIRWRWTEENVVGPPEQAVGVPGALGFRPLPGLEAIDETTLTGGGLEELVHLYGALNYGRLVVIGPAGAGKTAVAILLSIRALNLRNGEDGQVVRSDPVPVPVMLNATDWDPRREAVNDWVARRLQADHPFLVEAPYNRNTPISLVENGHVALIVDGFDETPPGLRESAIKALDGVAFRLTVLSRLTEFADAVQNWHLRGAAAVELLPLTASDVEQYLTANQMQQLTPSWRSFIESVHRESVVSKALSLPFLVSVVPDSFGTMDKVDQFFDPTNYYDEDEVATAVLGRFLNKVYEPRPRQRRAAANQHAEPPVPSHGLAKAQRWLSFLARTMYLGSQPTRFAWWELRGVVPATLGALTVGSITLAVGLAGLGVFKLGLGAGIVTGLAVGLIVRVLSKQTSVDLMGGLAGGLIGGLAGASLGFLLSGPTIATDGWGAVLGTGLAVGIPLACSGGFRPGLAGGLVAGWTARLAEAFAGEQAVSPLGTVVNSVGVGVAAGLAVHFVAQRGPAPGRGWSWLGCACGVGAGAIMGFGVWLQAGAAGGLSVGGLGAVAGALVGGLGEQAADSRRNGAAKSTNVASPRLVNLPFSRLKVWTCGGAGRRRCNRAGTETIRRTASRSHDRHPRRSRHRHAGWVGRSLCKFFLGQFHPRKVLARPVGSPPLALNEFPR